MSSKTFLRIDNRVDTVKGHCRRLNLNYGTFASRASTKYQGWRNVPDSVISAWLGVDARKTGKPVNFKEIMNYRGRYREARVKEPCAEYVHPAVVEFLAMPLGSNPGACCTYY